MEKILYFQLSVEKNMINLRTEVKKGIYMKFIKTFNTIFRHGILISFILIILVSRINFDVGRILSIVLLSIFAVLGALLLYYNKKEEIKSKTAYWFTIIIIGVMIIFYITSVTK